MMIPHLLVHFVSFIITSGYCKTGSMNLIFYCLDTCLQQRWNNKYHIWNWMHITFIYLYLIQLLLSPPYLILLHLCYLYVEDHFRQHCLFSDNIAENAVNRLTTEFTFHCHIPSSVISLCITLGVNTFFVKGIISHCVWHCNFYPKWNYHCKHGQCFNVQRLHKAPHIKNVLSW